MVSGCLGTSQHSKYSKWDDLHLKLKNAIYIYITLHCIVLKTPNRLQSLTTYQHIE